MEVSFTSFTHICIGTCVMIKTEIEIYELIIVASEDIRRALEDNYRNLFDNASDAIITVDIEDRVTSWNKAAETIFGWTAQEAIGKKLSTLIIPQNRQDEKNRRIDCILSGRVVSGVETLCRRKDGQEINVSLTVSPLRDANHKIIGMSGIIRDITERKHAKEELAQSEEKYRTLIDNIQDGVFIIQDAKMQFVNESFSRMTGCGVEEAIGKDFRLFVAPEDLEIVADNYRRRQAGEKVPKEYEFRMLHKDGKSRIIVNMYAGLITYRGSVASMGTVKDITDRKKAEEQIKNSLLEKETLLREIHHRVKNNMQIISSLLLLQSQNIVDQKYLDIFNDINNRILSMALIHEKLYESENLAQINIQEYINDLASNLMDSYGRKGNAKIEINVENIPLNINFAVPCGLILNELITNSLKYAFPKDRHGKIKIVFQKRDGNIIHFSVSDDGIGIPRDMDIRNTKSLGIHLITSLAENQLHGEIILNREGGTEFQINFKGE